MQLEEAYERLFAAYGPQHWWPAETPFEVVVGAVLTQNTSWKNVERAIANLRGAGVLEVAPLFALAEEELQELIRPAGFFRVKATRLRNVLRLIVEEFEGSLEKLFELPTDELRARLLAVNGVGPETADSIVLYAAGRPRFVVDAYTRRVGERHGWLDGGESYDAVQALFESSLESDAKRFNEYHALIVEVAKQHCRTKPRCEGCPLEPMLPEPSSRTR